MLSFFLGSDVGVGETGAGSDPKMAVPDNNRSALKANDSGLSLANRTAGKALIVIVALSRNTYVAFKLIQKVSKGMKLQSNTCRMVEEFQHSIIFNDFNFLQANPSYPIPTFVKNPTIQSSVFIYKNCRPRFQTWAFSTKVIKTNQWWKILSNFQLCDFSWFPSQLKLRNCFRMDLFNDHIVWLTGDILNSALNDHQGLSGWLIL